VAQLCVSLGIGAVLMWAAIPQLIDQPVLEMVPDLVTSPAALTLFGYPGFPPSGSDGPGGEGGYNAGGKLVERWFMPVGACHLMIRYTLLNPVRVSLGDRYSLLVRDKQLNGFNGDTEVIGAATGSFRYLEIVLQDAGQDVVSCVLRQSWPSHNPLRGEGLSIGCGYVIDDSGAFMYGFANDLRIGPTLTFDTTRNVNFSFFGGRSCSLRMDVDAEDIYGRLFIESSAVNGSIFFSSAAAHLGPFVQHEIYVPESAETRRDRQGTTVASLRSRSLNFTTPVGSIGAHPSMMPKTDWAGLQSISALGSSQFLFNSAYICAIAGQPYTNIAFVKPDVPWNSNVAEDYDGNAALARLRITLKNGFLIFQSLRRYTFPEITWDATSEGSGNNQYVEYLSDSIEATGTLFGIAIASKTFVRQNVFATIRRTEDFNGLQSETFDGVELVDTYNVSVTVFLVDGEPENPSVEPSVVWRAQNSKTLTAGEAAVLLAGGLVDLGDITVQGIGPA
jgi:hypothetical protein